VFARDEGQSTAVVPATPEADVVRMVSIGNSRHDTIAVTSQQISGSLVRDLVVARIEKLAEPSGLSGRERDVLRYLLLGRNVSEIGLILDISPRTVRYHQTNLLEKVGADSRMDLLRLIL
jgi:DNA-binding CsgD family transcriptional regulator